MPPADLTIPALPVLIPLGIALMIAAVVVSRRNPWRVGACWLAGWYAVAVFGATMLPLRLSVGEEPDLYRILWQPILSMRPDDFVLNIAMMVPLAAFLHVVFGVRDRRRAVLTGFAISAAIESVQLFLLLFLHGHRWADVNDLIANTLGTWLGWLLFQRLLRLGPIRRAAHRAGTRDAYAVAK